MHQSRFEILFEGKCICYTDTRERFCQGGPTLGFLTIDNDVTDILCCGPFVCTNGKLYIVVWGHTFLTSNQCCRIACIDIHDTTHIEYIDSPRRQIIELFGIKDNKLFFYISPDYKEKQWIDLCEYEKSPDLDSLLSLKPIFKNQNLIIEYSNIEFYGKNKIAIGNISINNNYIEKHKFGSPFLYNQSFIYIPLFIRSLFSSGFKLARISISDTEIHTFSFSEKLFFPERIKNNKIFFYNDMKKEKLLFHNLIW